jgi:hypothetical protein
MVGGARSLAGRAWLCARAAADATDAIVSDVKAD